MRLSGCSDVGCGGMFFFGGGIFLGDFGVFLGAWLE